MDKDGLTVPYIVYESEQARCERKESRLVAVVFALIILLFASNAAWLYSWMQYDYTSEQTVSVDSSEGIASYVGGDGSIIYGEDYCNE